MAKDRNGSLLDRAKKEEEAEAPSKGDHGSKSKRKKEEETDEDDEEENGDSRGHRNKKRTKKKMSSSSKRKSRRRRSSSDEYDSSSSSSSHSSDTNDSSSPGSDYSSSEESDSEEERRRRKRRERRRKEREYEKEKRRKRREKEKERKRRKREKDGNERKKKKEDGKKGAVTNLWGKYGIIRETDMWNKRPEFTAWLAEVKQVNLETLPNWEEKQMFKEFMEDHNTATFPSKKYYNLDAYHRRKIEKEMKKGSRKVLQKERTIFNDEEQRRLELIQAREKQKEEQVEALKLSMQSGMAQAMKEQTQLREEMVYQYKLGNFEAAAAIQRRLDPDVAM